MLRAPSSWPYSHGMTGAENKDFQIRIVYCAMPDWIELQYCVLFRKRIMFLSDKKYTIKSEKNPVRNRELEIRSGYMERGHCSIIWIDDFVTPSFYICLSDNHGTVRENIIFSIRALSNQNRIKLIPKMIAIRISIIKIGRSSDLTFSSGTKPSYIKKTSSTTTILSAASSSMCSIWLTYSSCWLVYPSIIAQPAQATNIIKIRPSHMSRNSCSQISPFSLTDKAVISK